MNIQSSWGWRKPSKPWLELANVSFSLEMPGLSGCRHRQFSGGSLPWGDRPRLWVRLLQGNAPGWFAVGWVAVGCRGPNGKWLRLSGPTVLGSTFPPFQPPSSSRLPSEDSQWLLLQGGGCCSQLLDSRAASSGARFLSLAPTAWFAANAQQFRPVLAPEEISCS